MQTMAGYLIDQWRTVLAEGGQMTALVFADRLDDEGTEECGRVARLLRLYYEIQTYVRMSQPVPSEWADEFMSLSASFQTQPHRWIGDNSRFHDPLGPFYTGFTTTQSELDANMDWLSLEPIRYLQIDHAEGTPVLESILSNYRMQTVERLVINGRWGGRNNDYTCLQRGLKKLTAPNLKQINVRGRMNDRLNLARVGFMANRTLPAKCILQIDGRALATK